VHRDSENMLGILQTVDLHLSPAWQGFAGESQQIRQIVRTRTGYFVAFFCQYTTRDPLQSVCVTTEVTPGDHISSHQRAAAEVWIKHMTAQYPPSKPHHPSR
jgi:hypothetical protein